jgi:hypothetical protein
MMPNLEAEEPAEEWSEERRLLEQAFFLRQHGERPPGTPKDDRRAETWADWERRAEAYLYGTEPEPPTCGQTGCQQPPTHRVVTGSGKARLDRVLCRSHTRQEEALSGFGMAAVRITRLEGP